MELELALDKLEMGLELDKLELELEGFELVPDSFEVESRIYGSEKQPFLRIYLVIRKNVVLIVSVALP